jgi:hypothetical protein
MRLFKQTAEWKPYFAWHPVGIDDDGYFSKEHVWLEWVERKRILVDWFIIPIYVNVYRLPKETTIDNTPSNP